ncbi:MAG: hypothetical protein ACKVY0_29435 [Prosthecobacter sp.]|uniref:hypothetical protein n=1 Tax=Prosthecobacter sp. TaxID=1965333 RepID=UPI0039011078
MTSLLIMIAVFAHGGLAVSQTVPSETDILREGAKGNVEILELARKMPVEEADSMLREAERRFDTSQPEVAKAAHRLLGELPGMAEYYERSLAELPLLHENTGERRAWLSVLASIPKRWALELLAKQLDDKRPLTSKYSEAELQMIFEQTGKRSATNALMAEGTLARRYADKIPLPNMPWYKSYKEEDLLKVKQWWEAHKNEHDGYFFDVTTWGADVSPSLQVRNQQPTQAEQIAPEAMPTPTTPSEEPPSSPPWSIIVVLIVAATGLLWLLLKRRS